MTNMGKYLLVLVLCLLLCGCSSEVINAQEADYIRAQTLLEEGKFDQAVDAFAALGAYKDSQYLLTEAELARDYAAAVTLLEEGDYPGAYAALCELKDYKDSMQLLEHFQRVLLSKENWETYFEQYEELDWSEAVAEEGCGYQGLKLQHLFRLKEEYCQKLYAPEKNTVAINIKGTEDAIQRFVLDEVTGDYRFENHMTGGWTDKVETVEAQAVTRDVIIMTENVSRSFNDDGSFDCYFCDQWYDWDIISFSGILYLYQG